MNNTITLSQLITRLAKVTDTDTNTARRFLRSFFSAIEEALVNGETVTIRGIGSFRRSSDRAFGSDTGVIYIPDETLAKEINAPFAIFEPVELADGVEFNEEENEEEAPKAETEPEPVAAAETPLSQEADAPAVEPVLQPETDNTTEATEPAQPLEPEAAPEARCPAPSAPLVPEEKNEAPAVHNNHVAEAATQKSIAEPTPYEEEEEEDEEPEVRVRSYSSSRLLWLGATLAIVLGAGVGLALAFLLPDNDLPELETYPPAQNTVFEEVDVNEISTEEPTTPVTEPEVLTTPAATPEPTAPVQEEKKASTPVEPAKAEPRYDTVTQSRFLATMAREYYGKGIYWVYIFEANKDVLDNPNKIKPGTRVVIPEKSSFAAATEKETQRNAERKQQELFKRYK